MRHSALMILYKRFSAELDDLEVRIYDCPAVTEDALLSESGSHRLEYSSSPRYAGEKHETQDYGRRCGNGGTANLSGAAWLCRLPKLSDKPAAATGPVSGIAAKEPMTC